MIKKFLKIIFLLVIGGVLGTLIYIIKCVLEDRKAEGEENEVLQKEE